MKRPLLVGIIAVVLGIGALSTIFVLSRPGSVGGSNPTQSANISPSGLELRVYLNTTRMTSGRAIAAKIVLFNSLDKNLSLPTQDAANSTIISTWDGYDFICDGKVLWGVAGYALFIGRFTSANLSSAGQPLALAPNVELLCTTTPVPSRI